MRCQRCRHANRFATRADARNLAFGHGIRYCLGTPLAQLEANIAPSTLLRRPISRPPKQLGRMALR
jgi:cytochrome P450